MTEKPPVEENAKKQAGSAKSKPRKSRKAKPKNSAKSKAAAKPGKEGGRPAWQPTIDERVSVEQMKFVGESDAMIARSLKVDVDTLRKHCAYELSNGYANRRRQITKLMFDAAEKGNAAAIKRLDDMGRAAGAAESIRNRGAGKPEEKPEQKPEKLGKKEQQNLTAKGITGKFAPPPPPKLVVNNK